jgi:hypothetical protein
MWHALRAELTYFRTPLLFAWAIALGVALLVNGLTFVADTEKQPDTVLTVGLPGIFFVIAAMVVAFIAQGTRGDERRMRLLLMGSLTPVHLGLILVVLPAALIALGVVLGFSLLVLATTIVGDLRAEPILMVSGVASQMVTVVQMGPLAQESTAARRQKRTAQAALGWTIFVVAIFLMALFQTFEGTTPGFIGNLTLAAALMTISAWMFCRRTDFTR